MEDRPSEINHLNVSTYMRDPFPFFADGTNPDLSPSEVLLEHYPVNSYIAPLVIFGDDLRIYDIIRNFLFNDNGKFDIGWSSLQRSAFYTLVRATTCLSCVSFYIQNMWPELSLVEQDRVSLFIYPRRGSKEHGQKVNPLVDDHPYVAVTFGSKFVPLFPDRPPWNSPAKT